jgi:hypothetical protein
MALWQLSYIALFLSPIFQKIVTWLEMAFASSSSGSLSFFLRKWIWEVAGCVIQVARFCGTGCSLLFFIIDYNVLLLDIFGLLVHWILMVRQPLSTIKHTLYGKCQALQNSKPWTTKGSKCIMYKDIVRYMIPWVSTMKWWKDYVPLQLPGLSGKHKVHKIRNNEEGMTCISQLPMAWITARCQVQRVWVFRLSRGCSYW